MQFARALWSQRAARPPLLSLAAMVVLTVIWFFTDAKSYATPLPKASASPTASSVEVLVKGKLELGKRQGSDDATAVHLSIPDLAYQVDAVVDQDGTFELPVRCRSGPGQPHFRLEVSQGDRRWELLSDRLLPTGTPDAPLQLPAMVAQAPDWSDPRSHLAEYEDLPLELTEPREKFAEKSQALLESARQEAETRRSRR